nr:MAG TPA: hypothetical protein [Caudoviricetes sp.]DAW10479.1 MAG TPA: hypothetical protein [Caudoviricetes sp.]DAY99309.1 MAG TPA: hypothetical protein [Caudoviricetes sp.]
MLNCCVESSRKSIFMFITSKHLLSYFLLETSQKVTSQNRF